MLPLGSTYDEATLYGICIVSILLSENKKYIDKLNKLSIFYYVFGNFKDY